jgi:peptidoglycan/xylan/chitin deacetylase (PgdA/CDA1 family)
MSRVSAGLGATPRLPILAYHSISAGPPPLCVSSTCLRDHLASLRAGGWRTLTLDELLAGHGRGNWPARSLMLTFDDGLADFASDALPLLAGAGFSAVVFVVAGRLGGSTDDIGWPGRVPARRLLDTGALHEVAASGVEIGSHSLSHASLSHLPPESIAREILDSRATLEDIMGRPVRSFSYPCGDAPAFAAQLVRTNFDAGFGIRLAYVTRSSHLETLERIDAYYFRERTSVADLLTAPVRARLAVRAAFREARRAVRSDGQWSF